LPLFSPLTLSPLLECDIPQKTRYFAQRRHASTPPAVHHASRCRPSSPRRRCPRIARRRPAVGSSTSIMSTSSYACSPPSFAAAWIRYDVSDSLQRKHSRHEAKGVRNVFGRLLRRWSRFDGHARQHEICSATSCHRERARGSQTPPQHQRGEPAQSLQNNRQYFRLFAFNGQPRGHHRREEVQARSDNASVTVVDEPAGLARVSRLPRAPFARRPFYALCLLI